MIQCISEFVQSGFERRIFLKKAVSAILAAVTLVSSLLLSSCGEKEPQVNSRVFYEYFDTFGTVYDYSGADYDEFSRHADEIEALLAEYHRLYDIYNEYEGINNIATLNKNAGKGAVKLDGKILDLLEFSKDMYKKTSGEVNIAFGAVLSLWHVARSEGKKLPERERLEAAAEHCDIDKLVIDRAVGTAEILDSEMSLDVGAVAKGYATEKIAEFIKEKGLSSYALDMGGNLRTVGTKPSGDGWQSAVRNPDMTSENPYIAYVELKDSAFVTSGVYERYYVVEGKSYHHIIDKETLFPEYNYLSVSVIAPSSAVADALSTALFNMTEGEVLTLLATLPDVGAIFVLPSGEVKLLGNCENVNLYKTTHPC